MKLSIVIPVYNSEKTIKQLTENIFSVLHYLDIELVLVNDCSSDNSEKICKNIALNDKRVKFISLRKNSGEHNAVICGLNYTKGDYVAIIDDDLQNPPSEILLLLNRAIIEEYDVVYAKYQDKKHPLFRNIGSKLLNFAANHLLKKPKKLYLSSFKLISKEIVEEIINYKGPFAYIDALILRSTDNIGTEIVFHEHRQEGRSNYTVRKLISLYLNIFVTFSFRPLRYITIAGFMISIISFFVALYVLYERIVLNNVPSGWTSLIILTLFSIGATFIVIGLLGEYIGKILMSLNNSPQYVIKKTYNTGNYSDKKVIEKEYDWKAVRV